MIWIYLYCTVLLLVFVILRLRCCCVSCFVLFVRPLRQLVLWRAATLSVMAKYF